MYVSGYYPESVNEGEGLRAVIFISGCKHKCKGCFNQDAWNFTFGYEFTEQKQWEIIEDIISNPLLDGITLCGGDAFFSAKEVTAFLERLNSKQKTNVWAYTGFTYEEILKDEDMLKLLKMCDVLIDGRFVEELKDTTLKFRGSSNQRIIDVKKSLELGSVVIIPD